MHYQKTRREKKNKTATIPITQKQTTAKNPGIFVTTTAKTYSEKNHQQTLNIREEGLTRNGIFTQSQTIQPQINNGKIRNTEYIQWRNYLILNQAIKMNIRVRSKRNQVPPDDKNAYITSIPDKNAKPESNYEEILDKPKMRGTV